MALTSIDGAMLKSGSVADAALATAKVAVTRQVVGSGLASGGGALSADQTITVTAATTAEAQARSNTTHAMTPATTQDAIGCALINTQIASYTLVIGDAGKIVEMNVASANNLTVPPNSSVAFVVGTLIPVSQIGAGQTTVVPGAGVTINSSGDKSITYGQYSGAWLYKRATDTWQLIGDLA